LRVGRTAEVRLEAKGRLEYRLGLVFVAVSRVGEPQVILERRIGRFPIHGALERGDREPVQLLLEVDPPEGVRSLARVGEAYARGLRKLKSDIEVAAVFSVNPRKVVGGHRRLRVH